ncbi:MAG TPA: DUF349 domain-containing protein [Vicinamibacterales bacterium]
MALMDRFRAHPGHKHPDPATRLEFLEALPLDERELIAEVAREDAEARVRRAAVAKLLDPATLALVARDDADEGVRAQANTMLRDLALEAFEGCGESESLAAADALVDTKALSAVARSAPRESTALRALARVTDGHVLGSIARHAEHESVRRAAFERLGDPAEILSVALNSDFKDPTVGAVDRISDRAELEQIAARAKNKAASKRARTIVREMDERQAALDAETAAAAAAELAERPVESDPAERARAAEIEAAKQADETRVHEETAAREEAAARQRDQEAVAERDRVAAAQELAHKEAARRQARRAELSEQAAATAALDDVAAARRQFNVIRREWGGLGPAGADEAAVFAKYTEADAAFAARDTAAHEADQRARREALTRIQQLLGRIEPLASRTDLTLKAGERGLRDVRAALGTLPPLPSKRDHEDILKRLKAAQTALTPKVQELRDVAGWQRWANVGLQEQLCEKMEALASIEDPEEIARQVRDLQQQWKQAADVPRAQGEALWRRFKTAHDAAWSRCEAYFAAQAEARTGNLARKVALSDRAEALADSTSWVQTADEIKKLQAEWKTIGPVTRGQEKAIWERFRTACDRFFTRRHADLAERKTMWAENLAKKEALCVAAEALSGSTDWDATASEIRRLQNEWKSIGPVKKSRSEALWQRFRGACDQFFQRYAQRHDIARGERVAAREAICAELEELGQASTDDATPPVDLAAQVRALRGRWQQEIAARGVDRDRAAALDARFAAAFSGALTRWPAAFAGSDLDPDANRKKMEALVRRMEELAGSLAGGSGAGAAAVSPTTRLASMLKEALAANTIGGKVDEESKVRAANEEVRQAQAGWMRVGPVPDATRRPLADRFQRALRRIADATTPKARV